MKPNTTTVLPSATAVLGERLARKAARIHLVADTKQAVLLHTDDWQCLTIGRVVELDRWGDLFARPLQDCFDQIEHDEIAADRRIDAVARLAIDPKSERGQRIALLDKAPVNERGEVEFSTKVTILAPQDAASAADDVEQLRDQRFCGAAAIAWLQTAAALGPEAALHV